MRTACLGRVLLLLALLLGGGSSGGGSGAAAAPAIDPTARREKLAQKLFHFQYYVSNITREGDQVLEIQFPGFQPRSTQLQYLATLPARRVRRVCMYLSALGADTPLHMKGRLGGVHFTFEVRGVRSLPGRVAGGAWGCMEVHGGA